MIDLQKIKELHKKGIVSESGLIRAKIIHRYESIRGSDKKSELYYKIGNEFCRSEGRVKNIITGYYRANNDS